MHIQYTQRLLRRPTLAVQVFSAHSELSTSFSPHLAPQLSDPKPQQWKQRERWLLVTPVSGTSVNVLPNNITIQHQMFVCHQIGFPVQFDEINDPNLR